MTSAHPAILSDEVLSSVAAEFDTPVLVAQLDAPLHSYALLRHHLPRVTPLYAMKSLPFPPLLRALVAQGAGFDVATLGEIDMLRAASPQLNSNFNPSLYIIHSHPVKKESEIAGAIRRGVTTFVVDCAGELQKMVRFARRSSVMLRIAFASDTAMCNLSGKFGCPFAEARDLLHLARDIGVNIVGIAFHTGSQAESGRDTAAAIAAVAPLFEEFAELTTLDIGGGFPLDYTGGATAARANLDLALSALEHGSSSVTHDFDRREDGWSGVDIASFCAPISAALDLYIPTSVQVYSEPGRFIAGPTFTAVSSVMGVAERQDKRWVYLDDGVYNSYSGQIFDGAKIPMRPLVNPAFHAAMRQADARVLRPTTIAGPTCDCVDVLAKSVDWPAIGEGCLVVGRAIGAYSVASSTTFNGYAKAKIVLIQPDGSFLEVKEGGADKRVAPKDRARVAGAGVRKKHASHGASIVRSTKSAVKSLLAAV